MKNIYVFIRKHAKICIPVTISLVGLITWSIFRIENFNLFNGVNVFNLFGTIQINELPKKDNVSSLDKSVLNNGITNISEEIQFTPKAPVNDKFQIVSQDKTQLPSPIKKEKNNLSNVQVSNDTIVVKKHSEDTPPPLDNNKNIIENGKKYSGILLSKSDKEIYNLILASPSTINFAFGASGETSYMIIIKNSEGDTVFQIETTNSQEGNIYLREGNYVMKITSGDVWRKKELGNKYSFMMKISYDENVATEFESNNTELTANEIPINTTIKASSFSNDVDYFTFTVNEKVSVLPEMDFKPVKNYSLKLYELTVADEFGSEIKTFTFRGDNKISGKAKRFILEAGTYIIRVSRVEDKSKTSLEFHEYNLSISAKGLM